MSQWTSSTARTARRSSASSTPALRVPTLVLDDGRALGESGAILWYLADGTEYLPADPFDRAKVLQWMFFEQYSHEPYIAVARFWLTHGDRCRTGGARGAPDAPATSRST